MWPGCAAPAVPGCGVSRVERDAESDRGCGTAVDSARPDRSRGSARGGVTAVFTVAAFLSATLLFAVQPLATRMVLPDFGGSAAVWTTSVLFFQTALLLGYLYTHLATSWMRARTQVMVHLALFAVPALVLPLTVAAEPGDGGTVSVVSRLLLGLTLGVGLPFFLVSTSGPLLQRWFSWTDHPRAHDPYFLYAASNVGSILGLLTYPVLVEPWLDLQAQAWWWTSGYALLGLCLGACAWLVVRRQVVPAASTPTGEVPAPTLAPPPAPEGPQPAPSGSLREVAAWIGLAFVPSSLMLGVTTFLSTDIAAIPLLWVVPLAVYLGTFVIAFGTHSEAVAAVALRAVAPVSALAAVATLSGWPLVVTIPLVVASFGAIAMVFHHRLAANRPAAVRLTAFYVWMSVGGALGGVANGVLAPLFLPGPFEFAIVVVLAALVAGRSLDELVGGPSSVRFWLSALATVGGIVGVGLLLTQFPVDLVVEAVAAGALVMFLVVAPAGRSKLAAVGVVALLALPGVTPYLAGGDVVARSFFGSYRVTATATDRYLHSGTTLHGHQSRDPELRDTPLSYYHPDGPVGDWLPLGAQEASIGVVGLGAGSIAGYTSGGQLVRFHEIDPTVVDLARRHFTYLANADGDVDVVVGDGRLTLVDQPAATYDVLVLDAFSSDSVPVHLLTREAFELYRAVLAPDGVILVHISNRYLDLEPVVAAGADAIGLRARTGRDGGGEHRTGSVWVALTDDAARLEDLDPERWSAPGDRRVVWTDAFSNLVSVAN